MGESGIKINKFVIYQVNIRGYMKVTLNSKFNSKNRGFKEIMKMMLVCFDNISSFSLRVFGVASSNQTMTFHSWQSGFTDKVTPNFALKKK